MLYITDLFNRDSPFVSLWGAPQLPPETCSQYSVILPHLPLYIHESVREFCCEHNVSFGEVKNQLIQYASELVLVRTEDWDIVLDTDAGQLPLLFSIKWEWIIVTLNTEPIEEVNDGDTIDSLMERSETSSTTVVTFANEYSDDE